MSKIIAVCNQKGGTGKTTSTINICAFLALAQKKILLIDADPQGNATTGLGIDPKELKFSLYDAILEETAIEEVIVPTEIPGLFAVPSHIDLTGAEVELVGVIGRETRLKKALERISHEYDYIFIDCPPSLGLLTINALTAAHSVLIPLQCEYYSLVGLSLLARTMNLVKDHLNPHLEIEGVLLTMADFRTNLTNEVIAEARSFFKEKVYVTIIPRNIRLSEAPGFGKPIALYDRKSIGAEKYLELCREITKEDLSVTALPTGHDILPNRLANITEIKPAPSDKQDAIR
ncbi:MAG: AAA family ATPase [Candidatus Omnitrophota bacterium]